MKKALSLILIACVFCAMLVSCNEQPTETPAGGPTEAPSEAPTEAPGETGISKEDWQAAIAEEKFDNVTILYDIDYIDDNASEIAVDNKQTVKICDGKVFRSTPIGDDMLNVYFTDEEAVAQRKMFLDVFLALLAERDNYVYDTESDSYKAPEKISVTVYPTAGRSEFIEMENGVVKFDKDGRLVSFTCKITDTITYPEGVQVGTMKLPAANSVWTFSNYGSTVITEEEIESAEKMGGPTGGAN